MTEEKNIDAIIYNSIQSVGSSNPYLPVLRYLNSLFKNDDIKEATITFTRSQIGVEIEAIKIIDNREQDITKTFFKNPFLINPRLSHWIDAEDIEDDSPLWKKDKGETK
jgi:hypothetical protein